VLFFANTTFSQIDSEIRNFVDSAEIIITNGRKLLLNSILDGDNQKAIEVYEYLMKTTEKRTVKAFYYSEILVINIVTENFSEFARYAKNYKEFRDIRRVGKTFEFYELVLEEIKKKGDEIRNTLKQSSLPNYEKQAVELFLCLIEDNNKGEKYSNLHSEFHRIKTNTGYEDFLRTFLPKPYKKMSMALSYGASGNMPTQKLAHYFYDFVASSMSVDFSFNRFYGSMFVTAGQTPLKKPFTTTTQSDIYYFSAKEKFNYTEAGFLFGYYFSRNDRYNLALYISSAGASLSSNRYGTSESEKEITIFSQGCVSAGIHGEFRIFNYTPKYANYYGHYGKGYLSMKLDLGIGNPVTFEMKEFEGKIAYSRLALVWGFGDF
jgi:hypothetical protein